MRRKVIFLAGPPCSGKSSVAEVLNAEPTELVVNDLDCAIAKKCGKRIDEIIRVEGEAKFRQIESETLQHLVHSGTDIICLGGGTLLLEPNRELVRESGLLLGLSAQQQTLLARAVAQESASVGQNRVVRPLLRTEDEVSPECIAKRLYSLLQARAHIYREANVKVMTDFCHPADIAGLVKHLAGQPDIFEFLRRQPLLVIPYRFSNGAAVGAETRPGNCHWMFIGPGAAKGFGYFMNLLKLNDFRLVADSSAIHALEPTLADSLHREEIPMLRIPSGETSKSPEQLVSVCSFLQETGAGRNSAVVALGGGVVGDLGGLAASVYMRGLPIVHLPTTVVAQVDSAIGGKTAINLPRAKNIIGSFHPASAIISDPEFLRSLTERQYLSGLAEVVKYGLICDSEFFVWLEDNSDKIRRRETDVLSQMISESSLAKLRHIVSDLEDTKGLRARLNFGHTVGHVVESLTGYTSLLHGEAVSIGMIQALKVGKLLGYGERTLLARTRALLASFSLPIDLPASLAEQLNRVTVGPEQDRESNGIRERWLSALNADKKRTIKELSFIVVPKIGCAEICRVDVAKLFEFILVANVENAEGASLDT